MNDSTLHSVVYVSASTRPFSPERLATLVTRSRERNSIAGITGMMLYKDGYFLQAIEGGKKEVCGLRDRIMGDPRHGSFIVLQDGPVGRREFPDWTMGFQDLEESDVRHDPEFSRLLKTLLHEERFSVNPGQAIRLLLSFAEQPVS